MLKEGTDLKYGARHLKRAIERHVVYPMANLLATEQIHLGDMLCIDWDASLGRLAFTREAEGAVIAVPTPIPIGATEAAEGKGRRAEVPSSEPVRETEARPEVLPAKATQASSRRKNNS